MGRYRFDDDAPDTVPMDLVYLDETALAVKVEDDDENTHWLPKSQISGLENIDPEVGEVVRLDVAEWLAKRNGMI